MDAPLHNVAVVGGGLVGLGWAIVFARSGLSVRLFDKESETRRLAPERLRASLADMVRYGLVEDADAIAARVTVADTLAEAVSLADYIQESVFERVDVKQAVSREIGAAMRPDAVVGSSSSGIPASAFTADVPNRSRFLIAHPVNPPHLVLWWNWCRRPGPIPTSCPGCGARWNVSARCRSWSIAKSKASC